MAFESSPSPWTLSSSKFCQFVPSSYSSSPKNVSPPDVSKSNSTSPLSSAIKPYRFRDEPDKKKTIKTEFCKAIYEGRSCKFGTKCNFAHHEGELRFTKLFERHDIGLIDKETHRTRPCLNHIATGDCPFGIRCSCLHDSRIKGPEKWWLPHCALKSVHFETDVHVDRDTKYNFSLAHYGHPFGKDRRKDASSSQEFTSSWPAFYNYIANKMDEKTTFVAATVPTNAKSSLLTEAMRIDIALQMRHEYEHAKNKAYNYEPTHKIFNEVCMLIQTQTFKIQSKTKKAMAIERHQFDPTKSDHVIVREIAFGPNSSPNDRPLALWFSILDDDVELCTMKEKSRLKRTERKLLADKKRMSGMKNVNCTTTTSSNSSSKKQITSSSDVVSHPQERSCVAHTNTSSARYVLKSFDDEHHLTEKPFYLYVPKDEAAYGLVSDALKYGLQQVRTNDGTSSLATTIDRNLLVTKNRSLENRFNSLRRHFATFYWSVNKGREVVDENTVVPAVDTEYIVPDTTVDDYFTHAIWETFVETATHGFHVQVNDTDHDKCYIDDDHHRRRRKRYCGVFKKLSKGLSYSNASTFSSPLPHLKMGNKIVPPPGFSDDKQIDTSIFSEEGTENWNSIYNHYQGTQEKCF